MSMVAPAQGRFGKYDLKCGFNQLCSDTQVLSFLQEVPNEAALFSFHLTKPQQREESPDWARPGHGRRVIWGTGLDGAARRCWSCRVWELGIGNAACGQHSAPHSALSSPQLQGELQWLGIGNAACCGQHSAPAPRRAGQVTAVAVQVWVGQGKVSLLSLPAESSPFPPAFYCLLQVVGKDLFPFFFSPTIMMLKHALIYQLFRSFHFSGSGSVGVGGAAFAAL